MDFVIPAKIWDNPLYSLEEKIILAVLFQNKDKALSIQEIMDATGLNRYRTVNKALHLFYMFGPRPPLKRTKIIGEDDKLLVAYKYVEGFNEK